MIYTLRRVNSRVYSGGEESAYKGTCMYRAFYSAVKGKGSYRTSQEGF